MGDVIHAMPALLDAKGSLPHIEFHWLVEESFAELPSLNKMVKKTVTINLRAWRKSWFKAFKSKAPQRLIKNLRKEHYDLIIDAQGLLKSALFARFIKAPIYGLDKKSAREAIAPLFYKRRFYVAKNKHAVERVRELFSQALNYDPPNTPPNYGLEVEKLGGELDPRLRGNDIKDRGKPYLVFLHNTTWQTKLWPESYWQDLLALAIQAGFSVYLTSGDPQEYERALRLKGNEHNVHALPRMNISEVILLLSQSSGVVSVDTGFSQLAGALAKPNLSLFGPTNPSLSRPYGPSQAFLSSEKDCAPCLKRQCRYQQTNEPIKPPCFIEITPQRVWKALTELFLT